MSESKDKIRLKCLGCRSTLQVSVRSIGKTARCPKCQHLTPIAAAPSARSARAGASSKQGSPGGSPQRRKPQAAVQPLQSHALDYLPPLSSSIPAADPNFYAYSAPSRATAKNGFPVWAMCLLGGMAAIVLGTVVVGLGLSLIGASRSLSEIKTELGKTAVNSQGAEQISPTDLAGSAVPSVATSLADSQTIPLTAVSPLPAATSHSQTGATVYQVSDPNRNGGHTTMRIYVPTGENAPKSLPCVFVAPAGTTLLHGVDIGSEDNMDELAPFIEAKMMVVCYSLDGPMPPVDPEDARYMRELTKAFQQFVKSDAGVLNGQVAINRVLSSFPEVDPERLFTTGHSSAATLSLLLGAKDNRISKVLAFAPITDLALRFEGVAEDPSMRRILPGIAEYLKTGSPTTYASQGKAEVWIAHAMDDDNEPVQNTDRYVKTLSGRSVAFFSPGSGGHYGEFLYPNIRKGILWLQQN